MFFGRKINDNDDIKEPCVKNSRKVLSLKILTVHISAMRYVVEYEIIDKEGSAEISLYDIRFRKEEDRRELRKRVECGIEEMIDLMNNCGFMKWDGFNGPNPKGILDGKMFTLKAEVNNGESVYATGSNNYPKNFWKFMDRIDELLRGEEQ